MPYKTKEAERRGRHRYYLAHKEAFAERRRKWAAKNRLQIKIAKELGVTMAQARALLEDIKP